MCLCLCFGTCFQCCSGHRSVSAETFSGVPGGAAAEAPPPKRSGQPTGEDPLLASPTQQLQTQIRFPSLPVSRQRVSEAVCQCISRSWGTVYSPPGNVSLCLSGVFRNKTRVMEDSGSVVYSVVLILIELLHTLPDRVKTLEILPSPSIR